MKSILLTTIPILFVIMTSILFARQSRSMTDIPAVQYALQQIGQSDPSPNTMIIHAEGNVKSDLETVWAQFSDLTQWKSWQQPLLLSVRQTKGTDLGPGAEFEQLLDLGFPLGKTISKEVIQNVVPLQRLAWWKTENGISSCHVWTFTPIPGGQIHITNTEVFYGRRVRFLKPWVRNRWQKQFQRGVNQLITELTKPAFRINLNAPVVAAAERVYHASPQEVWSVLTDIKSWPKWNPDITETRIDDKLAQGSNFFWKGGGVSIKSTLRHVEPDSVLTWTGHSLGSYAIHAWDLEEIAPGQTIVRVRESLEGGIIGWLYSSEKLQESMERWLEAMAQVIENQ